MKLTKKRITKLERDLSHWVYIQGMYRKMAGSWDIETEFNDDLFSDVVDDLEHGEELRYPFKVTAIHTDEDGGSKDWWYVYVQLDKQDKISSVTRIN